MTEWSRGLVLYRVERAHRALEEAQMQQFVEYVTALALHDVK